MVTFDAFTDFFEKLAVRKEIVELIQKYREEGDEEGTLGLEGLKKLLVKELGFDGKSSTAPSQSIKELTEPSYLIS